MLIDELIDGILEASMLGEPSCPECGRETLALLTQRDKHTKEIIGVHMLHYDGKTCEIQHPRDMAAALRQGRNEALGEGRRLKQPTIRNARRTQRFLKRALEPVGAAEPSQGYTPPTRTYLGPDNRADLLHHDTVSHRSQGALPTQAGEFRARNSEMIRRWAGEGKTKSWMKREHQDWTLGPGYNTRTSPEAVAKRRQTSKAFKSIWRKALKSGHVKPDGGPGEFHQPAPDQYSWRKTTPRFDRVDRDFEQRMRTPLIDTQSRGDTFSRNSLKKPRRPIPTSMNRKSRLGTEV